MNRFINTLAIALVLLTSISSFASREFKVEVNQNQILTVKISNVNQADKLVFSDGSEVLFEDKSLFQPYIKNISLEKLPNGIYSLHLEDGDMISSKTITKTNTGIEVSGTKVAFKPHFKQEDYNSKRVKVALSNPTMEPTQIKIFDPKGNLMFTFKNNDAVFNKTVDFSQVPSGEYSIAINNKGRNYFQSVSIK